MVKQLPPYLLDVLRSVCWNAGDDMFFVLGHLSRQNASAYMSKLKSMGLAYTHRHDRTLEVWPTRAGRDLVYGDLSAFEKWKESQ
jgi:hypothetical protein